MKHLICVLFFLFCFVGSAQNSALFDQGRQNYRAEKYQEAINNWEKIIANGEHSAALYFNIGNAHYKLNNIGPSIYYYEKALALSPGDSEVINNLNFAQNATIDSIEPLPQTIFQKWDSELSSWLTFNGWAWVAALAALIFTLSFLLYYFSLYAIRKRLFFGGSLLAILVFIISISMAYRNEGKQLNDAPAIVFAESTEVKNEPGSKNETSFIIHEGTKVQIISEEDNWCRVLLVDGKDGWMRKDDLKQL